MKRATDQAGRIREGINVMQGALTTSLSAALLADAPPVCTVLMHNLGAMVGPLVDNDGIKTRTYF